MRTIYALLDPVSKEIRYVGCTILKLPKRLSLHVADAKKGRTAPVWGWIRTLAARPLVLALEQTQDENAECRWIAELREAGFRLLNVAAGGPGSPGVAPSAESCEKMSRAQRGNTKSAGYKNALGHRHSPETLKRMSEASKARWILRKRGAP